MCLATINADAQVSKAFKSLRSVQKAALKSSQRAAMVGAIATRGIMADKQTDRYREVKTTDVTANTPTNEATSLSEDKETGTYEYIIYGGIALGIILILGFIAFIIYDNYCEPVGNKSYSYIPHIHPKADKPRIWYVNPTGEVKLSL